MATASSRPAQEEAAAAEEEAAKRRIGSRWRRAGRTWSGIGGARRVEELRVMEGIRAGVALKGGNRGSWSEYGRRMEDVRRLCKVSKD